jgi:hypothetical protein
MANCIECGKKFGFLEAGTNGLCNGCAFVENLEPDAFEQLNHKVENNAKIDAILLTTETAPNLNITKRIEIVTAECAFGMNIFKDLFAGVRHSFSLVQCLLCAAVF